MTELDIFPDPVTDENVHEMRVGQIGTIRGKLENVRYGDGKGRRKLPSGRETGFPLARGTPGLVVTLADWSMIAAGIIDTCTAKSIRIPLGTYVAVKVQCINEDAELMAIAIWELGDNPVPMPLGVPIRV